MKKLAIVASLVAVFGSVGLAQAASTGTITFNGELTATTCDVVVDGQTADATVTLPTIGTNQLTAATQTAGDTGFVMALNNCAGTLQTASAFFEAGSSVDLTTGRLKNLNGAGATGVSLQLLDANNTTPTVINAGNQIQRTTAGYKDISSGSADLSYIVRYYAEAPTTAGLVDSNVVYSIQYQ
ncbi:fimbrial protein [Serratia fonticola]|uniref:Type 1 fimbrial protein n=1 Tax=Serratia fonticola TaxID=47917 RepID=A0AAW3WNM6_SERFO|nr:fimbrial protein [Serratia fonticola]ALX92406.1 fimbrial protein [Serratia fonticola]MBC3212040.1 type 1 fimbrial protein [Serratia fonticola]MBC3231819.1 type 1 fimbrial protein [Serratia fonticola]NYA13601.1 type 1 fimbrial protein [Serratia fonticola]NYA33411.1 type 1 fimbrial protein [Serratia fonticola]